MRFGVSIVLVIMSTSCSSNQQVRNPSSAALKPPAAATEPATSSYFGVSVPDPYRWLEDGNAPAVQMWIEEQNKYAEAVMGSFADGPPIAKRVQELAITSPDRSSPLIAGTTLFYLRETPPQPQPVLVAEKWPGGEPRVLVNVNDAGGDVTITAFWPSPSGRYVAYGTAEGGSELTTIRVLDVTTAKTMPDALPYAGGGTSPQALAWDADERGVTYARYPLPKSGEPVQGFDVALYHHTLGSVAKDDPAVFGTGYSMIAEYRLFSSSDGKSAAALVNKGDGGFAEVFLRSPDGWRRVLDETSGVTDAGYVGDRLFVIAAAGSPRGRLIAVAKDGTLSQVLAEGDWAINSIAPISTGFLVVRVLGPRWRVDQYSATAQLVRTVPLPMEGISISGIASASSSPDALIEYSGWTIPNRWVKYAGLSGTLTPVFEVMPAADYSNVVLRVIEGTSKDGTKVPVSVVSMGGRAVDGTAPTMLNGYGGFGLSTPRPSFIGPNLAWLERGGILAYANLRGGGEFGEDWHQNGKGLHKQNVFDDFYAAAQALVEQRYTSASHLGILGGSNGGLLMGAEITQHPEAFRAVVSFVGIYDSLRHELFPNGKYNVTEYGSTSNESDFNALYGYSPYHHVQKGVAYPAVFMETGVNDPRVAPWQSRKFTAALQAATSSDRPILLVTRTGAGHGVGAPFSQRVGNTALALTFLANELK